MVRRDGTVPRMPAPADATADHIKDVNTRYHDVAAESYDAKWGIDFGEVGRAQVSGKLRKALDGAEPVFGDALEIGSGTGYFSLNLLAAGVIESATCTDISPGMLATLRRNAERLGPRGRDGRDRGRAAAVRRRELRPRARPRRAPSHPRPRPRRRRVPAGAATRGHRRLLRRAQRLRRPSRRDPEAGRRRRRPRSGGPPCGRRRPPESMARRRRSATATGSRARSTSTRSTRERWPPSSSGPASRASICAARSSSPTSTAGACARVEATAEPEGVPMAWRRFAFRSYIALQKLDTSVLEPRLPPAALLQPRPLRPQARAVDSG